MILGEQLDRVRRAYDLTVEQWHSGVDPLEEVPGNLKDTPEFGSFLRDAGRYCNSGAPENRTFLAPRAGMRFLDVGCAASLMNYGLHEWPSIYHGIDISSALVESMRRFVAEREITVGGLEVAEAKELPFENDHFDIAAAIGVWEYCPLDYLEAALAELKRVLKPGARVVMDAPNMAHPHADMMRRLEECLGRPTIPHSRPQVEAVLTRSFAVERTDDVRVMLKYFCRKSK